MLWSKETFLAPARNRTLAVQPLAHRYTNLGIPNPMNKMTFHKFISYFKVPDFKILCYIQGCAQTMCVLYKMNAFNPLKPSGYYMYHLL
jgi:hypothetical protein